MLLFHRKRKKCNTEHSTLIWALGSKQGGEGLLLVLSLNREVFLRILRFSLSP